MKPLPTVTIRRDNMNVRINASDYDEERDGPLVQDERRDFSQYDAEPAPMLQTNQPGATIGAVTAPAAPLDGPQDGDATSAATVPPVNSPEAVTAGPAPAGVVKKGRGATARFHVTDAQGNPVAAEGIDADGYADEAAAWAAIMGANA